MITRLLWDDDDTQDESLLHHMHPTVIYTNELIEYLLTKPTYSDKFNLTLITGINIWY